MERREGVTGTVVRKEKEQMICGCVYICSPWSQSPPRPFAEKTCGAQLRLSALFWCRENRALPTGFFIWQFRTIQAVPDAVNSESLSESISESIQELFCAQTRLFSVKQCEKITGRRASLASGRTI
jgi:hypothetical protein